MTNTVADTVNALLGTLTRTERRVAQVLLSQYPLLGLETLVKFAEAAQTTAPSVLRFVTKLGFAGYADFQAALRTELKPQLQSALNRHTVRAAVNAGDHYLHRYSEAVIANISRAEQLMPPRQFEAVVELLSDINRPILCIGGRFSSMLAKFLYSFLVEIRPRVQLIQGQTETWPAHLLDVGKRHILIVFDFRRYQGDVGRFAERAAKQGASLVVFTDEWMSEISRSAHHVIMSPVVVPSLYDSSVVCLLQIEALMGALGHKLSKAARKRIAALESLREAVSATHAHKNQGAS